MKKAILLLLLCWGCAQKSDRANIAVSLVDSNRSIMFKGLDYGIIADINRDTVNNAWQSLLPVYRIPADSDLKDYQKPQPGKYLLKDSAVIFTPDTPFKKDQTYFVRYYRFDKNKSAWDYILAKRKPGSLPYKDLIFKY